MTAEAVTTRMLRMDGMEKITVSRGRYRVTTYYAEAFALNRGIVGTASGTTYLDALTALEALLIRGGWKAKP